VDERRRFLKMIFKLCVHTTIRIVSHKRGTLSKSNRPVEPDRRPTGLSWTSFPVSGWFDFLTEMGVFLARVHL
jgi:hypothetical protein